MGSTESYKNEHLSRRRFIITFLVIAPTAAFGAYWVWQSKKEEAPPPVTTSPTFTTPTTSTTPTTTFTSPTTTTTLTTTTTETILIDPALKEKFLKLLPNATNFKPISRHEEIVYYESYNEKGALIGYVFVTEATAPTDKLRITGAIDLDYKVIAVDVEAISASVWNASICETEFERQFTSLGAEELMLTKDGGKVDGVTGATLSSKAVTEAIKQKIMEMRFSP